MECIKVAEKREFRTTYNYDAFGDMVNQDSDGSPVTIRYRYDGQEQDAETTLYLNNARCYDPQQGRWLNQDPLGFDAGDSNLYRYHNPCRPANHIRVLTGGWLPSLVVKGVEMVAVWSS